MIKHTKLAIACAFWAGLTGCGSMEDAFGINDPFAIPRPFDETNLTARPVSMQPKPVAIYPVVGLPKSEAEALQSAILERSNDSDVLAVSPGTPRDLSLRGLLRRDRDKGKADLVYVKWFLVDPKGRELGAFVVEQSVPAADRQNAALAPETTRAIAAKTIAGLETLLWPRGDHHITVAEQAAAASPEVPVYLAMPEGAPGDGNNSLQRALAAILEADPRIALASSPEKARAVIRGRVQLARSSDKEDNVDIAWVVTSPDGTELGKVTQANTVPQGSLDGRWGDAALFAAQAAAQGIVELFGRLEPAPAQR